MSSESKWFRAGRARVQGHLQRTWEAVSTALADHAGRAVTGVAILGYLSLYTVAVGDLGLNKEGNTGLRVVADPFGQTVAGEAIGLVELGPIEYLVSPVTVAVGIGLGALVGVNLAVTTLAWRRPAACGVSPTTGLLAGIPALLSGTACCGPLLLLVLGIQATGVLLTALSLTLPIAVVLLVGTLVYAAGRLDLAGS